MTLITKRPWLLAGICLFILGVIIRLFLISLSNGDLKLILTWYFFLQQHGIQGLGDGTFSNYPPAYLYLLWAFTLFSKWIPPAAAIKLIPTLFDAVSAIAIFKIARLKFNGDEPWFLTTLFLLLPTVMLNSTAWGQIDGAYASFLLVCFYLLLRAQPFWALTAFGVAFSFKAQAIFLLPFLGILFLRKQIKWYYFLIIPVIYLVLAIPTLMLGRSLNSILFLYAGQADQFENLARYAPNLYFLIPNEYYHPVLEIGLGIFTLSMLAWAWINWKAGTTVTRNQIALTALASAAFIPFLLPKMHDRYFYPADVLSFATAILLPELWFIPLLFQISSGSVYTIFLFQAQPITAMLGALINTALVIVIARRQLGALKSQ